MSMLTRCNVRSLVMSGLLLAACGDEESRKVGADNSLIGPEGGTISSQDSRLTLTIPAGALRSNTAISVESVSDTAPGQVGSAFRILPAGLHFEKPAALKLELGQANPGSANLHVASKAGDDWIWYPTRPQDDQAEADVSETGTFSLVPGAQLVPGQGTVRVGQTLGFDILYCSVTEPDADDLVALGYKCEKGSLSSTFAKQWSVNGVEGGSAISGTIAPSGAAPSRNASALFTAPARKPAQNPVAVSVLADFADENEPGQTATLVAHVQIEEDQPQPQQPAASFESVALWDLQFSVDSNCDHTWGDYGVTYVRNERHTGAGNMQLKRVSFGSQVQLEGTGKGQCSFDKSTSQSSQYFSKTRTDKGEGDCDVHVRVTMDTKLGAYDVYFQYGDITATYSGVDTSASGSTNAYGPSEEELSIIPAPIVATGELTRRLPTQGLTIEGNYDWAQYWVERQRLEPDFKLEDALRKVGGCPSGKTSWTLKPAQ